MKAFFFLFAIALLHSFTVHASLEETCSKVKGANVDYSFCITSLQVVPGSHSADTKGLAIIATDLAKTNFTHNIARIQELSKREGLSKGAKIALSDCSEVYSNGIDSLSSAVKNIRSGDNIAANAYLSAAGTDVETCDDSLDEVGEEQLLAKENTDASDITDLALGIVVLLK